MTAVLVVLALTTTVAGVGPGSMGATGGSDRVLRQLPGSLARAVRQLVELRASCARERTVGTGGTTEAGWFEVPAGEPRGRTRLLETLIDLPPPLQF